MPFSRRTVTMAFPLHYFLALLCVKLTFCGPVKINLDEAFEKGVNPECKSFPIPSLNSTFFADCEYPVPDLKNEKSVSRTLKFKLNEIICYSAVSNMMSLCPAGQEELAKGKELNVDIDSAKVDTFCEDVNSLSVQHDCERMSEHDKSDCDLLKKVANRLSTSEQCKEHCIVEGELFLGCQYLYASTRAVSKVLGEGVMQSSTQKSAAARLDIPKPPVSASSSKSPLNESQAKDDANLSGEGKKDDAEKGSVEGDGVKTTDPVVITTDLVKDAIVKDATNTKDLPKDETNNKDLAKDATNTKDHTPTNKQTVVVTGETTTTTTTTKNETVEASGPTKVETADDVGETTFGSSTSLGASSFESSTMNTLTSSTTTEKSVAQTDPELGKAGEIKGAEADKQTQPEETNKPEDTEKDPTPQKTEEPKPASGKGGGKNVVPGSDEDFLPLSEDYQNQYSDQKVIHNSRSGPIVENTMQADKSRSPDDASSSFFSYFILLSIVAIVAYLVFHNKQKILALILEGRRRQGSRRRSGGREYRKLDSNLEDTMNSESYTSGQHVIY